MNRHNALAPQILAIYPPADLTLERIGDLVDYDLPVLLGHVKADSGHRRSDESDEKAARPWTEPLA